MLRLLRPLALLPQLRVLDLGAKAMTTEPGDVLGSRLGALTGLVSLRAGGLALLAMEVAPAVRGLSTLAALTCLRLPGLVGGVGNLQYPRLEPAACAALARSLACMPRLEELDLSGTWIDRAALDTLAGGLSTLTALSRLSLRDANLGHMATVAGFRFLRRLRRLHSLDVSSNEFGMRSFAPLCKMLGGAAQSLRHLQLSLNYAYFEGAHALQEHLPALTNLTALELTNCLLSGGSMARAGQGVVALKQLAALRVDANIDSEDSWDAAPFAFVAQLTALTLLDLSDNYVELEGAQQLAAALASTSNMQLLRLDRNELGDDGVHALRAALGRLPLLQLVGLGGNGVSEGVIAQLRVALAATISCGD